jgi:hypothetical protein
MKFFYPINSKNIIPTIFILSIIRINVLNRVKTLVRILLYMDEK